MKLCELDHNGECLICDCWIGDCAFERLKKRDFKHENYKELVEMFFLNQSEEHYKELAKELNIDWRVIECEGDVCVITDDLQSNRLNFRIKNNLVFEINIE